MIQFEHVNVSIQGKRILSDIHLTMKDGEFVLICGESGCGKTTLTKLINGLIPHFQKDAKLEGTGKPPSTDCHKVHKPPCQNSC